ncbi:MAG: MGMT family protein [Planctomycetota bacterium]|nr:MGMT family protein [Planctomycetota bacterium]
MPWHRVLGSDGTIRVTGGTARDQAKLLRDEGVTVRKGRVRMAEAGWKPEED